MVLSRRGELQNMAVILPRSFTLTQRSEFNETRLKRLWRQLQSASQLERPSVGY